MRAALEKRCECVLSQLASLGTRNGELARRLRVLWAILQSGGSLQGGVRLENQGEGKLGERKRDGTREPVYRLKR